MFWGKDLQHRMSKKKSSPVPSIGNLIAQNRKERERESTENTKGEREEKEGVGACYGPSFNSAFGVV